MMVHRVEANGVSVSVPAGWEVEIDTGAGLPSQVANGRGGLSAVLMPRVHAANFALPAERGDFGSGAVEQMTSGDVFVCLLEEDGQMTNTALYAHDGVPTLTVDDFHPQQMQRPLPGQSGTQVFFHVGGRAFALYVAVGEHVNRIRVVAQVNEVLAALRFV